MLEAYASISPVSGSNVTTWSPRMANWPPNTSSAKKNSPLAIEPYDARHPSGAFHDSSDAPTKALPAGSTCSADW